MALCPIAPLLIALLCVGCRKPVPPRALRLSISVDPDVRRRPNWEQAIAARVARVSAVLDKPFHISWEAPLVNSWDPGPNADTAILLFQSLIDSTETTDVVVGYVGRNVGADP